MFDILCRVVLGFVGSFTLCFWLHIKEYIIFIFSIMEVNELTVDIIILTLTNPSHKQLSQQILQFLTPEDIKSLNDELQKNQISNAFTQLIRTHYFLYFYLNKFDRTFYYSFYDQPAFQNIQNRQIALLATHKSNCFLEFPSLYRKCFNFMQQLFPEEAQPQSFVAEIQRMITDTDIPMPKLKRENQGIHCRTPFQNYLVYLKYRADSLPEHDPTFDPLFSYLESKEELYLQKLFMRAVKDKKLSRNIRYVRFTPYQITYQNHQNFLIQKNSLHNLLVAIFALTDLWLTSVHVYVSALQDPFHRFVELITRYSVYRNFVISVQENLSFAFQMYGDLYADVFGGGKPMYRFWRPAMTKWLLKFQHLHSQLHSTYYYCLTQQRTVDLLRLIQEKHGDNPQKYIDRSLKNKLQLKEHCMQVNEILMPNKISNGIEDYFTLSDDLYQTLLVEWVQYMVDVSLNEETVHWCGYSKQLLAQPFLMFQKYVLAENKVYANYIANITQQCKNKHQLQYTILQHDIQFLQTLQLKPITLTKILQQYNKVLEQSLAQKNQASLPLLCLDYTTTDKTLCYFNQKANIKLIIEQQQLYFYSITPLITSDELLTKSITTMCSQEADQDDGEGEESLCEMEYFSKSSEVQEYEDKERVDREFEEGVQGVCLSRGFSANMKQQMSRKVSKQSMSSPGLVKQRSKQQGWTQQKQWKQVGKEIKMVSKQEGWQQNRIRLGLGQRIGQRVTVCQNETQQSLNNSNNNENSIVVCKCLNYEVNSHINADFNQQPNYHYNNTNTDAQDHRPVQQTVANEYFVHFSHHCDTNQ